MSSEDLVVPVVLVVDVAEEEHARTNDRPSLSQTLTLKWRYEDHGNRSMNALLKEPRQDYTSANAPAPVAAA